MTADTLTAPGWITAAEAAAILGVSKKYIYHLTHIGALPTPEKIGPASVYDRETVEGYKRSHPRVGLLRAEASA